jgi:hypothetical protein
MNLNKPKKSVKLLVFLCFGMCAVFIVGGLFAYLLKGWLVWDFDKPFPFGKTELITILKVGLTGFPIGLVFWLFDVR